MMAFESYLPQTVKSLRWLRLWALQIVMLAFGCLIASSIAIASPAPGTRISAQAQAIYVVPGETAVKTIYSNTVIAEVLPVVSFKLVQDNSLQRPASTEVTFPHLLTNLGNVTSTYTFTYDTIGCPTPNLGFLVVPGLYLDINGNGAVENGDRQLTMGSVGAVKLEPGESANLLVRGALPMAANGTASCIRLVVAADNSKEQRQNIDKVAITSNAAVVLNKAVSYSGLAQPGITVVNYTINANNIGNSSAVPAANVPDGTPILVDGQPRSLVLIRDVLPAGTQYVIGSLHTEVAGAWRLFRVVGDAPFSYHSEPVSGVGRDDATALEIAIGLPASLPPNTAVSMDFKARLMVGAPALVNNTAWADFHDGAVPTETASNIAVVKTTGQTLGLAKAANVPMANVDANGASDGTATVRFQFLAHNYGSVPLYEVGIRDQLENVAAGLGQYTSATLPAVGQYTVVANSVKLVAQGGAGAVASVVSGFTGQKSNAELLASHVTLVPGGEIAVQFDVRFNVTGLAPTLYNSATGHAATMSSGSDTVAANSVNGVDPDVNQDGNPNAHASPTPYSTQLPILSLLKTVSPSRPVGGAKDTYDLDIVLKVSNTSAVTASNVRLVDNLFCAFEMDRKDAQGNEIGAVKSWAIVGTPRALNGLLSPSASYTGGASCDRASQNNPDAFSSFPFDPSLSLVDGTRSLRSGESDTVRFTVRITLKPSAAGKLTVLTNKSWAGIFQPPPSSSNSPQMLTWATSSTAEAIMSDPSGVVYNSLTRQPVVGAVVTLTRQSCSSTSVSPITAAQLFGDSSIYTFNADGSVAVNTDAAGGYSFIFKVPPVNDLCNYAIKVTPTKGSGLVFPSAQIAAHSGEFAGCSSVTTVAGAPQSGQDTTYYRNVLAGKDTATGNLCEVFNNNIPLDPPNSGSLILKKTASTGTAEVGDLLSFTLTATNGTSAALPQLLIKDQLPRGFRYVLGSARMGGVSLVDPQGGVGPDLVFNLPLSTAAPLEKGQTVALTYQVRIGIGSPIDVDAINRAWAQSGVAPSLLSSNEADAKVRVLGGVFANEAYAFGKVFMDCNKNGIQDETELGIPGVRLFMEDGTGVVTDIEGKWSLYGLRPVTHALRLDTATLPENAEVALLEPRQSGQSDSLFLDLKNGEWHKANFAVFGCDRPELMKAVEVRRAAITTQPGSDGEAGRVSTRLAPDGRMAAPADVRGLPSAGTIDASGALKAAPVVASPLIGLPGLIGSSEFGAPSAGTQFLPSVAPVPAAPVVLAHPVNGSAMQGGDSPAINSVDALEAALPGQDRKVGFMGLVDKQVLPSALSNVRVKGASGSRLLLSVNGQVVDETRVGKRARMDSQQLEAWEYIAVQFQPGINTLNVEEVDGFGVSRGSAEIQLTAPGPLAKITLEAPETAKADERTPVPVKIRLFDALGVPVTERTPLTLESIAARWNATDLNSMEPGVQVMVTGGSGTFELVPPANPGDGKIRVSVGTLQSETRVIFLPDLRPLTGIGVLEGVLNIRDHGKMPLGAPSVSDAFESELRGWSDKNGDTQGTARTAFYFKGAVKGEYLLTAAYDSDKTTTATMFRDIQPDQFYPIYGDSSAKSFDAQSSQRLYVRIDKNRSFLLYGDYNAASSPEVRKLSQVSRSATGLQHVYNSEDVRVTSHYSRDSLKQVIEEFPANGTSGPYTLAQSNGSDLFANSETVQIVVRDRNQANSIMRSTTLTRFVDYSIAPLGKTILFSGPVPSLDADLNPQSIRVNYLVDTGGPAFDVAGVDVQLRMSDNLQLGAVVEHDGAPDNGRQLAAATALARLDANTVLSGELVGTRSDVKGDGQGVGIELRHDDSLLKYNLHVQVSDAGFDNPSAAIASGHSEVRGHLDYQVSNDTHVKAELVFTRDNGGSGVSGNSNAVQTQGVGVSVQTKVSPNVTTEVGLRAGQTDTRATTGFDYGATTGGVSVPVTTTASGATQDTLALRGRVTVKVPDVPNAQVYAEAEQDINDATRHIAAIGGNYAINDKARVYGRYELISSLGSQYEIADGVQRNVGLIGVESNYMKGGRIYDEYRIADTIDGRAMQSAMGVRNTFAVSDSLRLTGGLEQVSSLPGANGTSTGESRAVTGGFDWLGMGEYKNRLRGSGSLELREATDTTSALLTLGVAYKLDADWSMLTRATVNRVSNIKDGSEHWLEREQIGFAYRPVDQDSWNTLLRYEHKADTLSGVVSGTEPMINTVTDIVSAHLNYQPYKSDMVSARFAAKQSVGSSYGFASSYGAQLLYGRWTHDISQDWDFGLQAGRLISDTNAQQHTLGIELGYQLSQGLWLSAGYNVIGLHDPDLTGADYTDAGAYIRLRFKFDERLFSGNSSNAAQPGSR